MIIEWDETSIRLLDGLMKIITETAVEKKDVKALKRIYTDLGEWTEKTEIVIQIMLESKRRHEPANEHIDHS